jgi:hypothetical protein
VALAIATGALGRSDHSAPAQGATAVEYAIINGLISVILIG